MDSPRRTRARVWANLYLGVLGPDQETDDDEAE
jgi:hypothetical protein